MVTVELITGQLMHFFPSRNDHRQEITLAYNHASGRAGNTEQFDFNGDRYAVLLYYLSNGLYLVGNIELATKVYLMNKALHGIDLFYEVDMPDKFELVHPVGTVLGRATYSDGLKVYQNVNIGSNNGIYPVIGENFTAHPGASVLGNCKIGKGCAVGAGSVLIDMDLPDGATYVGNPLVYKIVTGVGESEKQTDPRRQSSLVETGRKVPTGNMA